MLGAQLKRHPKGVFTDTPYEPRENLQVQNHIYPVLHPLKIFHLTNTINSLKQSIKNTIKIILNAFY